MNSKDWLILSILTFLTVAAWTVYDIYHAAVTSTITPMQKELIKPLKTEFDEKTLLMLKERKA